MTSYRGRRTKSRSWEKKTHLDNFIPTARDDDRVHHIGAEAYARYPMENVKKARVEGKTCNVPLGMTILLDIVLALTESVPELDGPVA